MNAIAFFGIAQNHTLVQVDLSPEFGVIYFNNYLLSINNHGYVCGYVHNTVANDTFAVVVTPIGKTVKNTDATTGSGTHGIMAVAVNDSDGVLLTYTDASGNTGLMNCYMNEDTIDYADPVSGLEQTVVKPFSMNNKGDIMGWYKNGLNRWMFCLHSGTPPAGFNAWQAWRYNTYINSVYTYYNTMAGGMDTNRVGVRFYIDGSNNIPILYEELYAMFYPLTGYNGCHPWGKNNTGQIVGKYKNGSGYLNAFVASPTFTPGQPSSGVLNMPPLDQFVSYEHDSIGSPCH